MNGVTRQPAFWIAYALLAALALAVAWWLFPLAIPLVNLDIKLGRQEALAGAQARSEKLQLAPAGARTAARFAHDQTLQNYVELEGGGKPAFAKLVGGTAYAPYWWEVRLFAPGEVTEALVRFRPDGAVYGFARQLPETWMPADPAGHALAADSARRIAEVRARADWDVDFGPYVLLEQLQQKRTSGRVDHGFVYEREGEAIGGAHLRLRLAVTGDALTEVTYFAKVPEAFERRFQELRSANNTIAGAASLAAGLLYGLGGCVIGVLWLLRRDGLLWRPALAAGFVVGGLVGAMSLAATPTAWFGFDTAQSVTTFWTRQIGSALVVTLGGALGYALVFMAAESLSRRAFGDHPQLWRIWSRAAAPTRQVLGRTVAGYLFVPIELALVAAFYYASNRWLGWWQPSESLTDPNILGSAIPALAPIALSLQAGFMEECLFRAVPLSLAAIIGARYGRRGLAIGIAVIVQALIFGGAHANYPGIPAYSRLVELFVPSVLWALIFLRFGLVPTITLHAVFDLVLFSIPVFLVDAPGGDLQRALVVAAGLVPLGIVVTRRVGAAAWGELAPELRNGAWRSAVRVAAADDAAVERGPVAISGWIASFQRTLPLLAVAGLAAWAWLTPFGTDAPAPALDRGQAVTAADAALAARDISLPPEWRRLSAPRRALDDPTQAQWHKFVWQEAGGNVYRKLIGSTLAPPAWDVRYAKFDGDVADRAEEWRVTIVGDGTARSVRHALPEARPGAKLSQTAGLALAQSAVRDQLRLDPAAFALVAAEEKQRPARTDWTFVFAQPGVDVGKEGQARIVVRLAGDEVAAVGRLVHVPEAWQRAEREREGGLTIVKLLLTAGFAIAALAALGSAVLRWTRGQCDRRALVTVAAIAFAAAAASVANGWPLMAIGLSTAEPIVGQASIAMLGALLRGLLVALLFGLAAGVGAWAAQRQPVPALAGWLAAPAAGVAALLLVAGVAAIVGATVPRKLPLWPELAVEAMALPALEAALDGLRVLPISAMALFALDCIGRVTAGYTRWRHLAAALLVLAYAGAALVRGEGVGDAMMAGVGGGLLAAVVVYAVLRYDYRAVPAYVATGVVLQTVTGAAQKAGSSTWLYAALTAIVAIACAWLATRYLERSRAERSPAPAAAGSTAIP